MNAHPAHRPIRFTRRAVLATSCALGALLASPSPGRARPPDPTAELQDPARTVPDSALERIDSLAAEIRRLSAAQDSLRAALERRGGVRGESQLDRGLQATADQARRFGFRTLLAFLLMVFAFLLIRGITWLLDLLAERSAARRLLYKRLVPIVRVVIWAAAVTLILKGVYDLDARTLLTAGAAIGVAIGFAAQDILKNIFGGLVIIGDRPFQAGDKVRVGETYGEVVSIGLRSTRIVTPDDSLVSVPNAQIVADQVSNANSGALDCQVVTDLYLPGWVDAQAAREIAYRAAATSRYVYLDKPIVVLVRDEVHHTFLTHLRVKAYVHDIRNEFKFRSDVTERARTAFRAAGLLPPWHGAVAFHPMDGEDDLASPTAATP